MSTKASNTKKKSAAGKTGAGSKGKALGAAAEGTAADEKLALLEDKAAEKPSLIRPEYKKFTTPKGEEIVIRKLSVGERDEIVEKATKDGELNWGDYVHNAVSMSLEFPKLSHEQIPLMGPENFEFIWDQVEEFSYRSVAEVIKTFRKPDGNPKK